MRANNIKEIWRSGGVAVNAWASIPSSYAAEVLSHQGFDSVTVDLQQGVIRLPESVLFERGRARSGAEVST